VPGAGYRCCADGVGDQCDDGTGTGADFTAEFGGPALGGVRDRAERLVVLGAVEWIGPYRIERAIARGGFGVVYLASQEQPVRRQLAIKVLDPGRASEMSLRLFKLERQVPASLSHPGIATMIDAGQTSAGQMYLVMELVGRTVAGKVVPALTLTQFCDEKRMTIRQRLELFKDVCHAVQHAHGRGVIHRDLKPSNILVAESEGKPVAKVIDFGISKLVDPGEAASTRGMTEAGAPIGTLAYMSPEQAKGEKSISTQSDVYSLGAVL